MTSLVSRNTRENLSAGRKRKKNVHKEWLRRPSGIRQFLKCFMREKGTCRRPQHCAHVLVAVREILTRQMAPCGLERAQLSRPLSDSSGESSSLVSTYSGVIYGNNQESRFLHPERSCTAIMVFRQKILKNLHREDHHVCKKLRKSH
ncbi:uncharacterized protein LOC105084198 isoform X3 [Camelus bactrianus]